MCQVQFSCSQHTHTPHTALSNNHHSFYPRPSSGSGGHSSSSSHHHSSTSSTGSQISTFSSKQHSHSQKSSLDSRSAQQLDIAKALLDLPQSRSPARGPFSSSSQKSSPGKSRSPATKKKMSSSSPGEREGYYPCNRCGRYRLGHVYTIAS